MNPAWSIVVFTTLAGSAQGLVVALALSVLLGHGPQLPFLALALGVATLQLLVALAASFLHLGHKLRAWRAVLMWRTSWMSREVIVLPAFIAVVAAWWIAASRGMPLATGPLLAVLAVLLAVALWYCTAMIYACLRFVQEWAHPLTVVNYTLIGLASGLLLAAALGAAAGALEFSRAMLPWALAFTLLAWAGRAASLRRNDRLRPKSTLQSATGIRSPQLVQKAMGMTGGSFNTREFFHRASRAAIPRIRWGFQLAAFAVPALLLAGALASASAWPLFPALLIQFAGLLGERWFFFAQARHPQNLYYQVVS